MNKIYFAFLGLLLLFSVDLSARWEKQPFSREMIQNNRIYEYDSGNRRIVLHGFSDIGFVELRINKSWQPGIPKGMPMIISCNIYNDYEPISLVLLDNIGNIVRKYNIRKPYYQHMSSFIEISELTKVCRFVFDFQEE